MYTSQKFSQQLQEAGFDGESEKIVYNISCPSARVSNADHYSHKDANLGLLPVVEESIFPAYDIIYDLCIRYAKEVWGEAKFCDWIDKGECPKCNYHLVRNSVDYECARCDFTMSKKSKIAIEHSNCGDRMFRGGMTRIDEVYLKIRSLLQNGKSQDEIEDYIKTHSVLFNK